MYGVVKKIVDFLPERLLFFVSILSLIAVAVTLIVLVKSSTRQLMEHGVGLFVLVIIGTLVIACIFQIMEIKNNR